MSNRTAMSKAGTKKFKGRKSKPRALRAQLAVVKKDVSKVKRAMNSEVEIKDTPSTQAATTVDYNGTIFNLWNLAQGDAHNERVGDSITINGVDFRFRVGGTTASALGVIRVIMFIDKEGTAVTTAAEVLATTGSQLAPLSFYNREYRARYKVLYDRAFTSDDIQDEQDLVRFVYKKPFKVVFAPAVTTIRKNAVKLLVISNQTGAPSPFIEYNIRTYFKD